MPPAGGGTASFRPWLEPLGPGVEVWVATYPGRGARRKEPPLDSIAVAADGVAAAVRGAPAGPPWVAAGQSFGGVVGFEVAHRLRDVLRGFVAVAARAPSIVYPHPSITDLSDAELVRHIGAQGGIPAVVLEDAGFVPIIAPPLRADFALLQAYRPPDYPPLTQPVMAVGGTRDVIVRPYEVEPWRRHASGLFRLEMLDGGHFVTLDASAIFFPLLSSFLRDA
jgi:surfactin synthase thioesterase subunit